MRYIRLTVALLLTACGDGGGMQSRMTRSILMAFSLFFLLYISATGEKLSPPFFPILQGYLFPLGFLLTCLSISLGGTTMRTSKCLVTDLS